MSKQSTYIYFLRLKRPEMAVAPTEHERRQIADHLRYLMRLGEEGTVILAGPSLEPPRTGIVVFKASSRAEAHVIMDADPAIKGGIMIGVLSAFSLAVTPGGTEG
jgi:uncharacterized protein YciI